MTKSSLALAAGLVVVVLFFQNCGPGIKLSENQGAFEFSSNLNEQNPDSGGPGPAPLTGTVLAQLTAVDASLNLGTQDSGCLNNANFDACIFWKNPKSHQEAFGGAAVTEPATTAVATPVQLTPHQNFGIQLDGLLTGGQLRNADFDVFHMVGTTKTYLGFNNGQLRTSYVNSASLPAGSRFATEQIMTFFYLQAFKTFMVEKAGRFFAGNRNIPVNAASSVAGYNAFYDFANRNVEIGFRTATGGGTYPLALNAEISVHEISHANFAAANPALEQSNPDYLIAIECIPNGANPYYITDRATFDANINAIDASYSQVCQRQDVGEIDTVVYCATDAGCLRALDEGQADFFAMAFFSRGPSVGDLALPAADVRYWGKRADVTRANSTARLGFTYTDDFLNRRVTVPGEIHDLGEIYSEILFDIYADPAVEKNTFLRTVSEHLAQLGGTSTFVDSKTILLAIDQNMFASRNRDVISRHFTRRGY